jgi:2,3-bisphosphoglycerate-dependent phosphoglycerate mutase
MAKLILLRHIKSQWNFENRFAGWTDGPLFQEGKENAKEIAEKLSHFKLDKIYTSPLFRNMDTVARVFEYSQNYPFFIHLDGGKMQKWGHYIDISENDAPVFVSEKLNERYYGRLQGENKEIAAKKYGKEKVHLWRRSYDVAPPGGESLKDVTKRTIPFYQKYIEKDLKEGKNVLIVASHNSLRAITKYVEKISDNDIINFEIPYAGIIEYELDESLKLKNKRTL